MCVLIPSGSARGDGGAGWPAEAWGEGAAATLGCGRRDGGLSGQQLGRRLARRLLAVTSGGVGVGGAEGRRRQRRENPPPAVTMRDLFCGGHG